MTDRIEDGEILVASPAVTMDPVPMWERCDKWTGALGTLFQWPLQSLPTRPIPCLLDKIGKLELFKSRKATNSFSNLGRTLMPHSCRYPSFLRASLVCIVICHHDSPGKQVLPVFSPIWQKRKLRLWSIRSEWQRQKDHVPLTPGHHSSCWYASELGELCALPSST